MISCVIYACIYDMVQTKIWHNSLKTVTRSGPQSFQLSIDVRVLQVQTIGDLTHGLELLELEMTSPLDSN